MTNLTIDTLRDAMRLIERTPPLPNLTLFESPYLTERYQFRRPVCKSKRIAKKWAKNPKNFREKPSTNIYMTPQGIFAHPIIAKALRATLKGFETAEPGMGNFMGGMLGRGWI